MNLTLAQQQAVNTHGNVLVVAGAGSGKTSTLVERCVSCLLKHEASLDQILMLTFTDASAAEMRQRIRERLEFALMTEVQVLAGQTPTPSDGATEGTTLQNAEGQRLAPAAANNLLHWQEQLALFETAHIGTLHSFCLELVRQHFYELELDPKFAVMADEEARLLAIDTLEKVLDKHYAWNGTSDKEASAGATASSTAVPAAKAGLATSAAVQKLIQIQGGGWDRSIRNLVLRIHQYSQTLPDPKKWFADQLDQFSQNEPKQWLQWLLQGISDWRDQWTSSLEQEAPQNQVARVCAAELAKLGLGFSRKDAEAVLQQVCAAGKNCPYGKKTEWRDPLKDFLAEAGFLLSLTRLQGSREIEAAFSGVRPSSGAAGSARPETLKNSSARMAARVAAPEDGRTPVKPIDPLLEDWHWVAQQMTTLLQLAREFSLAFAEAKREMAAVDFHDLEQFALRLLWDFEKERPTEIARQWRQKLRFVFVDEYQDINAAQDKIIQCLCREGAQANRFLVGDVKQSIYRFRLANPAIFQGYVEQWSHASAPQGSAVNLSENFRSRERLLEFVNAFFATVMRQDLGGVSYDESAHLKFGAPEQRQALSVGADGAPAVELHLRLLQSRKTEEPGESENGSDEEDDLADLGEADKEARLLALRLHELHSQQFRVWDKAKGSFRPMQWSDVAILLRSRVSKSESYAKEFARLNIPLLVERGNFYQTLEISDLLNLLRLLDNPLQDLPVLGVLRSPLVGLTIDELATIRLACRGPFWKAVLRTWRRGESSEDRGSSPSLSETLSKSALQDEAGFDKVSDKVSDKGGLVPLSSLLSSLSLFLDRFHRWRRLARQASLSRCLDTILAETHYAGWLRTQPQGEQRYANVQRLLGLAEQFDRQRHGLFRFLRFVEAQQLAEVEPPVAAVSAENSVRLMSIHQSKGLEFPVVALPDLGKPFNVSDQRADLILDERFGLCPQIKPPESGKRYPSLPHWLASHRQHQEMLGEELRLLYVGMTRARDRLILSANISERKFNERWKQTRAINVRTLTSARSYADWIGAWFSQQLEFQLSEATNGESSVLTWRVHDDQELRGGVRSSSGAASSVAVGLPNPMEPTCSSQLAAPEDGRTPLTSVDWPQLRQRLEWQYRFMPATRIPAKSSVTLLRRRAAEQFEEERRVQGLGFRTGPQGFGGNEAEEIGKAHHKFLQLVSLENVTGLEQLSQEAERLTRAGCLTPEESARLDLEGLAAFWDSELGGKILAEREFVRRELLFTARFPLEEIAMLTGETPEPDGDQEFVVVQGVADLVVLLPSELWLLDFKTDRVRPNEMSEKVRLYEPQLRLYAQALSRIYRRPVTGCWLYFLSARHSVAIDGVTK